MGLLLELWVTAVGVVLSGDRPGVKAQFGMGFPWLGRMGLGLGKGLNRAEVWVRLGLRFEVG